ncbi:hypothetical protein FSP39_020616 [Pinctada imbricata]|uniref:Tyrosinase copper-binding domain-containing protein n=1 Tax=Pinctada imbricata TaxID=66713 RepID=A0AA88XEZ8_PINIB|nr:hypothetical protein FSP39_020616 [Pinctada imbricata]
MPGTQQVHSVTFSDKLFGNGYGTVINGPFRNWKLFQPYNYRLRRNIGQEGSLTRPEVVDLIAFNPKIIRTTQIVAGSGAQGFDDPDTGMRHSLERCHDNTHVYIGGVFTSLKVTAQDPVFWFFHAYIDYVWELFRQKQRKHGIDPSKDYPEHGGEDHKAIRTMVPFFAFRNIDGYSNMFTEKIYRYAPHPTCGNRCGGASKKFLYCPRRHHRRTRCVSRSSNVDIVPDKTLKEIENPVLEKFVRGNLASRAIVNAISLEVAKKDGKVELPDPRFSAAFNDDRVVVDQKDPYFKNGVH